MGTIQVKGLRSIRANDGNPIPARWRSITIRAEFMIFDFLTQPLML